MHRAKKGLLIFLCITDAILLALIGCAVGFLTADALCEETARFVPSYEMIDLTPYIEKENWTEEDYDTVFRQTGLARPAVENMDKSLLPMYQEEFFFEGMRTHTMVSPVTMHDILNEPDTKETHYAFFANLQKGDIILTSTTHMFGWRHGHAALVVNPDPNRFEALESVTLGEDSGVNVNSDLFFRKSTNFMVVRLKGVSEEERAAITDRAVEELSGIPYSVFVGFFSPKDQCKDRRKPTMTHCSHLVWQAYMNAGYDLDCNGGPLVQPSDIARSPLVEIVQIYGFDPDTLW